jgi:hypothetical protein
LFFVETLPWGALPVANNISQSLVAMTLFQRAACVLGLQLLINLAPVSAQDQPERISA